jgi:hypothetical protein
MIHGQANKAPQRESGGNSYACPTEPSRLLSTLPDIFSRKMTKIRKPFLIMLAIATYLSASGVALIIAFNVESRSAELALLGPVLALFTHSAIFGYAMFSIMPLGFWIAGFLDHRRWFIWTISAIGLWVMAGAFVLRTL